jgi:hypothetical protein
MEGLIFLGFVKYIYLTAVVSTHVVSTDLIVESTVIVDESTVDLVASVEAPPQDANVTTTPIARIAFFIVCFFLFFINIGNKLIIVKF